MTLIGFFQNNKTMEIFDSDTNAIVGYVYTEPGGQTGVDQIERYMLTKDYQSPKLAQNGSFIVPVHTLKLRAPTVSTWNVNSFAGWSQRMSEAINETGFKDGFTYIRCHTATHHFGDAGWNTIPNPPPTYPPDPPDREAGTLRAAAPTGSSHPLLDALASGMVQELSADVIKLSIGAVSIEAREVRATLRGVVDKQMEHETIVFQGGAEAAVGNPSDIQQNGGKVVYSKEHWVTKGSFSTDHPGQGTRVEGDTDRTLSDFITRLNGAGIAGVRWTDGASMILATCCWHHDQLPGHL